MSMRPLLFALALIPQVLAQDLDCEAAAEYSAAEAGLAVLVYRGDELIFEQYHNGHDVDRAQHLFSGTKSFAPIVALIAQQQGLLTLDELVCDTITEWQGDELRGNIRIRHLLDFTSGLEINDREMHARGNRDWYATGIAAKGDSEPGTKFRYGSCHLMVFGELLKRKLAATATANESVPGGDTVSADDGAGEPIEPAAADAPPRDFVAYLQRHVLDQIDCKVASWLRDAQGNPALPYGAFMTAREWGKFGRLMLHRGRWGDDQIVPAEHFDECFQGSEAMPTYGLNFWLHGKHLSREDRRIPADTVVAAGMYKQQLYVIPSADLVIVRLGRTGAASDFADATFLGLIFDGD